VQKEKLTVWRNEIMSSDVKSGELDRVLDLLSKPLSRYILSVLAGVDPGTFTETTEVQDNFVVDDEDKTQ